MVKKKTPKHPAHEMPGEDEHYLELFKAAGLPATDIEKAHEVLGSWPQVLSMMLDFGPKFSSALSHALTAYEAGKEAQKEEDAEKEKPAEGSGNAGKV